jgi:hypothetical protein
MKYNHHVIVAVMIISSLLLTACQKQLEAHKVERPAEIVKIDGSNLSRVTLTEKAIKRLDLQTDQVREEGAKIAVPYSSLIYDPQGQTWIYTSPQPRTFVRHKVEVDYIKGHTVFLKEGPPAGTVIASVAVAELYGAEFKVGH